MPIHEEPFREAREILNQAVEQRAFPGAVLAVGYKTDLTVLPVGRLSYAPEAPGVTADTLYDLASLTKVVATTTAAMILAERSLLGLDRPVAGYLPDFWQPFDTGVDPLWSARGEVTVRHLLAHTSGLPDYEKFFLRAREKSHVVEEALALPLQEAPGRKRLYSDVGFILLGEILELAAGEALDRFCQREIFAPLEMPNTGFNPPQELWDRIAPTEWDESFRKRLIQGEVHDENAWVMGGVAGHSGLFSTAGDLARFCRMMLAEGRVNGSHLIQPDTIREFTRVWPAAEGSPRGLGWDKPSDPSSSGHYFSAASYGHLGFTGTSLWMDPEKVLFVILLTNRIHLTRANESIRTIRPAVHDAVAKALHCST
ncbi:MAG: beta-lactamase family protein [Acidobacteria bacterium]|nr:beta-lactamase family protein [Acidobacteriota bacterium]